MTAKYSRTRPLISPVSSTCTLNESRFGDGQSIVNVCSKLGFKHLTKITETLQGSVWSAVRKSNSGKFISSAIKVTQKSLHENAQGIVDGAAYYVHENIISEKCILKYLTQQKTCPDSIIKYRGFCMSDAYYYLFMEDGGYSLFAFVVKVHNLIRNGIIEIDHWKQVIKIILKQMIECISYIHSKNICHFDISLENFLINDVEMLIKHKDGEKDEANFVMDSIQIKLIDFGLAEVFKKEECWSKRSCGKTGYKSPEMFFAEPYDAKKNDIWALGICLFMMTSGTAPWRDAKTSNDTFAFVMRYSLRKLLKQWNMLCYFDDHLFYLLRSMLLYEADRITLENIKEFVDRLM